MIEKQNFKLSHGEKYISSNLLENLIKETDIQKAIVEEMNSELWFDTFNGYGSIFFTNNVTYNGRVKYGLLESESEDQPSTITFPNGTKYIGTVFENQITGKGTYYFPKGGEYTGGVLNGLRHGFGTYKSSTGIIYDGEWEHGLKNGKGKIIQGDMILEGEWSKGIIEGKGRIKWKNGNVYDGNIHDNKMHGNGYIIWYDGNQKYTGQWTNDIQNGLGVFIWFEPKGEQKMLRNRYVGEWVNGKRHGFGMFYYSNGSYYEGYWRNDKKEGFGIFTFSDRKQYIGTYKEDRKIENPPPAPIPKGRLSVASVLNTSPIRSSEKKGTPRFVNKESNKGLNIIKELDESKAIGSNKQNDDKNKDKDKNKPKDKDNKAEDKATINSQGQGGGSGPSSLAKSRIEQSLSEIKLVINIDDLIEMEKDIKASLKELDNVLLRNLSFITRIYNHALGKEYFRDADLLTSTISPSVTNDNKSQFNNAFGAKQDNQQEERKDQSIIEFDCIYNEDLYFCLDLKGLWKLLREVGLVGLDLTLASFDRLYFNFTKNYIEMFYMAQTIPHEKTYDYLYQMILRRKMNFNNENKASIETSNRTLNPETELSNGFGGNDIDNINSNEKKDNVSVPLFDETFDVYQDIHDGRQIILLRHFYELLIRTAYLKFNSLAIPIDQKLKKLIEMLKGFFKAKKKNLDGVHFGLVSVLEIKLKNWEISFEAFNLAHEKTLRHLFIDIYKLTAIQPVYNDMTIKYSFLYELLMKNDIMKELIIDKIAFSELASFYHKEKLVVNQETIKSMSPSDAIKYINSLLDVEMVFFEFVEALFFICKKYNIIHRIDEEEDEEAIKIIKQCIEKYKEESSISSPVYYFYPHLKTHLMIEKLQREEEERLFQEQKRKEELGRCHFERKVMENEDTNCYEEPKENKSEESNY